MNDAGTWRLGRRPALDGLRGVAVLLVIYNHLTIGPFGPITHSGAIGQAGVDMFFTLSGFLITSLLVEEYADTGRISLGSFYLRRARRLLPALGAAVVGFWMIGVLTGLRTVGSVWAVVLYVANWVAMDHPAALGMLNPTWTLSIEEQFYLLWPLLLIASLRWRNGPFVTAITGLSVSTGLRFALWTPDHPHRDMFGSDTRAAALLVGVVLALLAHRGLSELTLPNWVPFVLAVSCAMWVIPASPYARSVLSPTVVPVVTVAAIWLGCSSGGGWLSARWLRYVGRRSYALYLWHFGFLWLVLLSLGSSLIAGLFAVALSFGLAELSWRYIERPFLRSRDASDAADELVSDLSRSP